MTDDPVGTYILIGTDPFRTVHFQVYLVERSAQDPVCGVEFRGSVHARPTADVCAALSEAETVIIAPSNPIASIGPMLAISGIQHRLAALRVPILVVSPIIAGRSLKGPTDAFLRWAEREVSPLGVARHYQAILGNVRGMLVDPSDERLAPEIEALGIRVHTVDLVPRQTPRVLDRRSLMKGSIRCPACGPNRMVTKGSHGCRRDQVRFPWPRSSGCRRRACAPGTIRVTRPRPPSRSQKSSGHGGT